MDARPLARAFLGFGAALVIGAAPALAANWTNNSNSILTFGAPSGSAPSLVATGTDSAIPLLLVPAGTAGVGIGTAAPQSKLHIQSGEVQVGSSGASCATANQGAIRYNGGLLYYCDNASTWEALDSSGQSDTGDYYIATQTATPTAGQGMFGGGSTLGAVLAGYGSTADVTLENRSGTPALEVIGNSTKVYLPGNVGIGTTAPQNLLTVNGSESIGYNVAAPASGLIVQGNVGIGVSSVNSALTIGNNIPSGNHVITGNGGTGFGNTYAYDFGPVSSTLGMGLKGELDIANGSYTDPFPGTPYDLKMGGPNNSIATLGAVSFSNQKITLGTTTGSKTWIDTSGNGYFAGNVGIGTTSPGSPLQVNGNILVGLTNTANPFLVATNGYGTASNPQYQFWYNSGTGMYMPQNNSLAFSTNSSEALRITSAGYVGIGTTVPGATLEVYGTTQVDGAVNFKSSGRLGNFSISDNGGGTATLNNSGNSYLVLLGSNVGVGTTSPAYPLSVASNTGSGATGVLLDLNSVNGNLGNGALIQFSNNSDVQHLAQIGAFDSGSWGGKLAFYTSPSLGSSPGGTPTERMRITDAGNVGIGTTSPNNILTVYGSGGTTNLGPATLGITATTDATTVWASSALDSALTAAAGHGLIHLIGASASSYNSGYLGFRYVGSGSSSNYIAIGLYGIDNILNVTGGGAVGIGTTSPSATLDVNGAMMTECVTVSTLPTGKKGMRHCVTDATSCTFLGSLTGGGSTFCPAVYNGSAWVGG